MDFAERLRTAVDGSGLSLEEIVARLAERGTRVSTSSLSAWQSGLSRPSRAATREALAAVESVLDLPPGELLALLGAASPVRRRGPRPEPDSVRLWNKPDAVRRLLARLGAVTDDLSLPPRVSRRMRLRVDAQGNPRHVTVGDLLRTGSQPATRVLYLQRFPWVGELPSVVATTGVTAGRFRGDFPNGLCAHELMLDPPLPPHSTAYVEFSVVMPPQLGTNYQNLRVRPGCRDFALTVDFDAAHRPARCWGYRQQEAGADEHVVADLSGDAAGTSFQFARLDPAPGIYGIRWEYPAQAARTSQPRK
ncbi:helix-turn-helix domain-containing protein [Nocardioides speluncae]|uniref:helix-turn-helix domain-containing protein n=1 Tax=Nocardioides speluncae TaxID=2670337 RepID=UPI000D6943EE|nr:hypothetical protein [Nocardioides speluncae]